MQRDYKKFLTIIPALALALTIGCDDDDDNGGGSRPDASAGQPDAAEGQPDAAAGMDATTGQPDAGAGDRPTVPEDDPTVTCDDAMKRCTFAISGQIKTYDGNQNWIAGWEYVLTGTDSGDQIRIANGELTVAPGVTVFARGVALVIEDTATINANGTADNWITFTSAQETRNAGDWGGLILVGQATANCQPNPGEKCSAEAGLPEYGGSNDAHSSGTIRYARFEFGGSSIDTDNQYNGLTLYTVGNGTTLEYIHIHRGLDDNIEFFGGTASVKYLLLTGSQDDTIDWSDGWRGSLQFVVVEQYPDGATEHCIEADGTTTNNAEAQPFAEPVLSNVTLIGRSDAPDKTTRGALLRVGTGGQIWNSIITGADEGIQIRDQATIDNNTNLATVSLVISNTIANDAQITAQDPVTVEQAETALGDITRDQNANISADSSGGDEPDYRPSATTGFPTFTNVADNPNDGDFSFDVVDFIGAVDPDDPDNWTTADWISFPAN